MTETGFVAAQPSGFVGVQPLGAPLLAFRLRCRPASRRSPLAAEQRDGAAKAWTPTLNPTNLPSPERRQTL